MTTLPRLLSAVALVVLTATIAGAAPESPGWGHSRHGKAFDQGPRQRPWDIECGDAVHFPVTSSNPEVQHWFDQGLALTYNFWEYEAERSFRWCLKLDPDCAMAYWGLALCVAPYDDASIERMQSFLHEALKRSEHISPREQAYLEVWKTVYLPEESGAIDAKPFPPGGDMKLLGEQLELLALQYPDDVDAKALLVLARLGDGNRYGQEAIIRDILAISPRHPAPHHFRIHTWDGKEGVQALDSCERYASVALDSGHANHMPGHVYSGVGMWHEAAIWMDRATRTEQAYMEQSLALPFETWNYAHNRNYLSFIQEQLGMPSLSLAGARQLIAAPLDPQSNSLEGGTHSEGLTNLVRCLVKFERWDEILSEGTIPWTDNPFNKMMRAYAEGLAHLGKGDLASAIKKQAELRAVIASENRGGPQGGGAAEEPLSPVDFMEHELAAGIALAQDDPLEAIRLLSRVAPEQAESYRHSNDPPQYPNLLYTVLGEVHLKCGAPQLAAEAFRKTLETNLNDAFALSGLTRAEFAAGHRAEAQEAYSHLLHVWQNAEPDLRWLDDARQLGLQAVVKDASPRPQRNYNAVVLDPFGPQSWAPYAAPTFDAVDPAGAPVTLSEYSGRPVLLVFYLGAECVHCVEQLNGLAKRRSDFESRNVALLAVSSDPVTAEGIPGFEKLPFRVLSDPGHANARRYRAYDEFEDLPLHATILIDKAGRMRWIRAGGDPFTDYDFLIKELDRIDKGEDLGETPGDASVIAPPQNDERTGDGEEARSTNWNRCPDAGA